MGKAVSKVNSERKRARFSKEFKLEAVRLLELEQKPATQLKPTVSRLPSALDEHAGRALPASYNLQSFPVTAA